MRGERQQLRHDADGNLTTDGRWTYTWDAENRLVSVVARTSVGLQQLLRFEYDWRGRRIHKQVWNNTGGTGSPAVDVRSVYDGWNLLAEVGTSGSLVRSYVWGSDLSGLMEGAGGVGGLLEVTYYGTQTTNCFAPCDGNGNVVALANAADGKLVSQYEYGPFGELLRATGPMSRPNAVRFSTKYQDDETDLLDYGYRFLNTSGGRWLSRDSAEESGGWNLYGFAGNEPVVKIDPRGQSPLIVPVIISLWFLTGCSKPDCVCKKVKLGQPSGSVEGNFTALPQPNPRGLPGIVNLGIVTPYTIEVKGDPYKCTCSYTDSGSAKYTAGTLGSGTVPLDRTYTRDCVNGKDAPGFQLGAGTHGDLPYTITYSLSATVKCTGSDGVSMQDTLTIPPGPYSGRYTW